MVASLKKFPQFNASLDSDGETLILKKYFNIGIAVDTPDGLVVPVLRDCDQKSFSEIEQAIVDYAGRARDGKIQFEDLQGGCFTISNGGIYGSLLSTPILKTIGMKNFL